MTTTCFWWVLVDRYDRQYEDMVLQRLETVTQHVFVLMLPF